MQNNSFVFSNIGGYCKMHDLICDLQWDTWRLQKKHFYLRNAGNAGRIFIGHFQKLTFLKKPTTNSPFVNGARGI